MINRVYSDQSVNWRAAAVLGLITSTFSAVIASLTAARIGRDAVVDWMVVASIPLRDPVLQAEPSGTAIVAGILFHQWADFSWAMVFFGLLGRWTARWSPLTILVVGVPWALFTSSLEWLFLVPVVPFWQPVFTLEQPYWIGYVVHLTSSSLYPLFPWLRDRIAGREPSPHRRFAMWWGSLAAAGTLVVGILAFLGSQGRELPYIGDDRGVAYDQSYMRRMTAHHAQGIAVARLATAQAEDQHLNALARLMIAAQEGEIRVFEQWWRSWFSNPPELPAATAQEHAAMPGMLSSDEIAGLERLNGAEFDQRFIILMTFHHKGAIAMAEEAIDQAGDPRLKLMSQAIRHEQRGEIELMHGAEGFAATIAALSSLIEPAGEESGEQHDASSHKPSRSNMHP
jgi:uncharacterized protein (DUF305 family)